MTRWQEDFAYGKFWVDHLVPWLRQRNIGVIRARDTGHDGAPLIELSFLEQPSEDLVLFWRGRVEFWEVKSKRKTAVLDVANTLTTGCDTKCVDEGFRVERETGWPVRVVFVHPHRNEVVLARLADFDPRLTRGNGGARGERLSYCAVDRLEWLCSTDELLQLAPADKGPGLVSWPAWLPKREVVPQQAMLFELPTRRPPFGVKGWPQP